MHFYLFQPGQQCANLCVHGGLSWSTLSSPCFWTTLSPHDASMPWNWDQKLWHVPLWEWEEVPDMLSLLLTYLLCCIVLSSIYRPVPPFVVISDFLPPTPVLYAGIDGYHPHPSSQVSSDTLVLRRKSRGVSDHVCLLDRPKSEQRVALQVLSLTKVDSKIDWARWNIIGQTVFLSYDVQSPFGYTIAASGHCSIHAVSINEGIDWFSLAEREEIKPCTATFRL